LNFVLLTEAFALGFECCLCAPQLFGLVPKLGDEGVFAIGLFRNLRRASQQVIELGAKLVIARDDLL
jgi:hypothetical protein